MSSQSSDFVVSLMTRGRTSPTGLIRMVRGRILRVLRPDSGVMSVSRPWENTISVVPSEYSRTVTVSRQYESQITATEG